MYIYIYMCVYIKIPHSKNLLIFLVNCSSSFSICRPLNVNLIDHCISTRVNEPILVPT